MPTVEELKDRRKQRRAEKRTAKQLWNLRKEQIKRLTRRIKLKGDRRGLPNWLPSKFGDQWRQPWKVGQSSSADAAFKKLIWEKGYVSPNFTRKEAGGRTRHPLGCDVPGSLHNNCQYHAFTLERVRHDLGDKSMTPGSWYRCGPHNSAVGGASASQHMQANATDWFSGERDRLGGTRFDAAINKHFAKGGRGYQSRVGGPIRHADNGPERQWVYA
jgi:hypothetical protein